MSHGDPDPDIPIHSPTTHAMLIVWGQFAQTLGLREQLATIPIPQKTVRHSPQEKLTEFLVGLLAGIEYLTDLSEGAAPLVADPEVARAWGIDSLADASSVSRTLQRADDTTLAALRAALAAVSAPFVTRAVADLRAHNETFLMDADLTGRPVTSSSRTYPGAAFGFIDGEVRLGYQLAEICLQTRLFGRQWLSARHHPGDRAASSCLRELLQDAERCLGCHPRRRTELVAARIAACEEREAEAERLVQLQAERAVKQGERLPRLSAQIEAAETRLQQLQAAPLSPPQGGPRSVLGRLQRQVTGWQKQRERAKKQQEQATAVALAHRERAQAQASERDRLRQRFEQLEQENRQQPAPPRCKMRLDAGFATGENLTELYELGSEIETKASNSAVARALREQLTEQSVWTRVGKNAEMIGWPNYQLNTCPYPVSVGLERFHTPKGMLYAVLIRSQEGTEATGSDLAEWFGSYNGRQTIEAGNKEEKSTFKVQHLMSRSPAGIQIQALLTVFAANFVRWAKEWIHPRVEQSSRRFEAVLSSPKRLVRVAANSPGTVERAAGGLRVCFSPLSSLAGVVIRLGGAPGNQLSLPLFETDQFWPPTAIRPPVAQDLR